MDKIIKELWDAKQELIFAEIVELELDEFKVYFNRILKTKNSTIFYFDYKIEETLEQSKQIAKMSNAQFEKTMNTIDFGQVILDYKVYRHYENDYNFDDRYKIKNDEFGNHFYDKKKNKKLTLKEVCVLLNKLKECANCGSLITENCDCLNCNDF